MARSSDSEEVQRATCQIVALSGGEVPTGSAAFVNVVAEDAILQTFGLQPGGYLVTSSDTLEDIGALNFLAEFLDKNDQKPHKFFFDKSGCTEVAVIVSGEGDHLRKLSFIAVDQLVDQRSRAKRLFSRKSFLQKTEALRCNFQAGDAMAEVNGLVCLVLCALPYKDQPFYYRQYLTGVDGNEFFLTERMSETKVKFMDEFGKEERARGSPIVNNKSELVGVLSYVRSASRKLRITPVWLNGATPVKSQEEDDTLQSVMVPSKNTIPQASENNNCGCSPGHSEETCNASFTNRNPIDDSNPPKEVKDLDEFAVAGGHDDDVCSNIETPSGPEDEQAFSTSSSSPKYRPHSSTVPSSSAKRPAKRPYSVPGPHRLKSIDADMLVKDAVVQNINAMDALACLDKVHSQFKKSYVHLAEHFNVGKDKLLKMNVSSTSHPCECLFFYLTTVKPDICFGDIKKELKEIGRDDVYLEIKDIPDEEKLSESSRDLIHIYVSLETGHHKNWEDLGKRFKEVDPEKLIGMKSALPQDNPVEAILDKAYCEDSSRTIGYLKECLEEINRRDVCEVLDKAIAAETFTDLDPINALLEELDVLEKVSLLLYPYKRGVHDWRHLAKKLGICREEWQHLETHPPESPTKQLIKFISCENPRLTVGKLFEAIVLIGREDVLGSLRTYFDAENINKILCDARCQCKK